MRCVGGTWSVVTKQGQVKPDHRLSYMRAPSRPTAIRSRDSPEELSRCSTNAEPRLTCHRCSHCATDPTSCHRARTRHCCWSACMRSHAQALCATARRASDPIRMEERSCQSTEREYLRVLPGSQGPDLPSGWVHSVAYLLSRAGDVHPRHPVRAEHDVQPTEVRDHPPGPPRLSSTALGFRCSAAQRSARRHAAPHGR